MAFIAGITRLHSHRFDFTFEPMILSKASSVRSASGPKAGFTAALQTRMSGGPHSASVPAIRASTSSLREMLQAITAASAPVARIAAAASSQASALRDETTTRAPSAAMHSAVARPMPRDDPVTTAMRPSSE